MLLSMLKTINGITMPTFHPCLWGGPIKTFDNIFSICLLLIFSLNQEYDYAVDMWSFGCIVACMIFQKYPFFDSKHGDDRVKQLRAIVKILGTKEFEEYWQKYEDSLPWDCDELRQPLK